MRADTRQGLPRQGAIEWFPLKSPALCFSSEVDNAQTITVLGVLYVLAVAPSLWGWGGHTRRKLFSSHLTRGVVSEVRESSRALRRVFPNTHAPKGEKRRVLARWTKTTFTPLHFFFSFLPPKNKRFQTNGIRPGLNSDGVYTFHSI